MLLKVVKKDILNQLRNLSNLPETISNHLNHNTIPLNANYTKILRVAIIGLPNAGKSTFINNLMDRKVGLYYHHSMNIYNTL